MTVYNRWNITSPKDLNKAIAAGIEPCPSRCMCGRGGARGVRYPTGEHGRRLQWQVREPGMPGKSFALKKEADAYQAELTAMKVQGRKPFDRRRGEITFRAWVEKILPSCRYTGKSQATVVGRLKRHAYDTFGDLTLNQILERSPALINTWLAELKNKTGKTTGRPLHPETVARIYDAPATFLKKAHVHGLIDANPCAQVPYPHPPKRVKLRPWTRAQVESVIEHIDDRYRIMALLGADAGLRVNESAGITVGAIHFQAGEIDVTHQAQRLDSGEIVLVPPKGQEIGTVPMSTRLNKALAAHMARYPTLAVTCQCHGAVHEVLLHNNGKLLDLNRWMMAKWQPTLKSVGMIPSRDMGPHQLRHFCASEWLAAGVDMFTVAQYLRHKSTDTTETYYAHLVPGHGEKTRRLLDARHTRGVPLEEEVVTLSAQEAAILASFLRDMVVAGHDGALPGQQRHELHLAIAKLGPAPGSAPALEVVGG